MRTTAALIKENAHYVTRTGFDRPAIVADLRQRAMSGDAKAAAYMLLEGGPEWEAATAEEDR